MTGLSERRGVRGTTLILPGRDIAALMSLGDWRHAVETGFRAAADGRAHAPPPMAIEARGGAFHAKGAALLLDRFYVALKLNGNFPGNPGRGLPTIQGAMLLCDGETGALLAVMDSIEVTLRRTAAATALAARYLARPASNTILICGCGAQAPSQLDALRDLFPLERLLAWDVDPAHAERLALYARGMGMAADAIGDLVDGRGSDIVVTCTTAQRSFLTRDLVAPGTFVAAVGADSPDKSEIDPMVFADALVAVDSLDQCRVMGDLHHALAAQTIEIEAVHAELAELIVGRKGGRTSDTQIALFDSTGIGLQDVACAAAIYERALQAADIRSVRLQAAA